MEGHTAACSERQQRRRAANDVGAAAETAAACRGACGAAECGGVQRTTMEATCSERRRRRHAANDAGAAAETAAACGDGGGVPRACGGGMRWMRRSSGLSCEDRERYQFHILVRVS